jgi:hypothetical protein
MPSASSSPPPPAPQRTPVLRELPGGIDALDAELGALVGRRLLKVGILCTEVEFTLLGHHRALDASRVYLELSADGGVPRLAFAPGAPRLTEVRLPFPQRDWGWRLYEVMSSSGGRPGSPASAAADAEGAVRRRRDDMLRRVFS